MKKLKFIETLMTFAYPAKKYQYKYLVINKTREYSTSREDGIFRAKSFNTKKEVSDFLKYEVAKVDLEDWKIYVLDEQS